jgi:D-alanyl-D-alanine carboxypeptidase (penicillin-binding protein 5/6)
MTVREIAQLARYIIKEFPEYYPLFALREFNYRIHRFHNRNPLLGAVAGVDGIKTGYVKEGGYGIVVSAKQDNHRLILAINGASTAEDRKDDARRLLEWGFRTTPRRSCSTPARSSATPASGAESACICPSSAATG